MLKLRAFLMGVVFAAVAVGFAAAVPHTLRHASDEVASELEEDTATEDVDPEEQEPSESGTNDDSGEEGEVELEGNPNDNHGAAVSTAAHCDLEGQAHAELVQEVAHDKEASVADAEALCTAALAEAEAQEPASGSDSHGRGHSKAKGPKDSVSDGSEGGDEEAPVADGGDATEHGGAGGSTKAESPASHSNGKATGHSK
jgi:hypothetical protein